MVKNSFISTIRQEKEKNYESVKFQVFSFTDKIRRLTVRLELHKRDFLSQRGIQKILRQRQCQRKIEYIIRN